MRYCFLTLNETPPPLAHTRVTQEMGLQEVKNEMAVEVYDRDAVQSHLGEVLDEFIRDLG